MRIEVQTLALMVVVSCVLQTIALFALYRVNRTLRGPGCWVAGAACYCVGFVFNFLRGQSVAGLLAIVVNNFLFIFGMSLMYVGFLRFLGKEEKRWLIAVIVAWVTLPVAWFSFASYDMGARRIFISLGVAAVSFLAANALYRSRAKEARTSAGFLASVFTVNGFFFAFRGLGPFVAPLEGDIFASTPMQVATYLEVFTVSTLWSSGCIVMVNQRLGAERLATIEELESLSRTDGLTGLSNRRYFDEMLEIELSRALRTRQPLALLMIDVDYFKAYNDSFGHQAGDECLRKISDVFERGARRAGDLAARYGGEEFAVIAADTDLAGAKNLADSLRVSVHALALQHPTNPDGKVTISIGVAVVEPDADTTAAMVVKFADDALYSAKGKGRNRVESHESAMPTAYRRDALVVEGKGIVALKWRAEYACGERSIDAEHFELFRLANSLLELSLEGDGGDGRFRLGFDSLIRHVEAHFEHEEELLRRLKYEGLALQEEDHRALLARAKALRGKLDSGGVSSGELVEFLAAEVVTKHMLRRDVAFFPLFWDKAQQPGCECGEALAKPGHA